MLRVALDGVGFSRCLCSGVLRVVPRRAPLPAPTSLALARVACPPPALIFAYRLPLGRVPLLRPSTARAPSLAGRSRAGARRSPAPHPLICFPPV